MTRRKREIIGLTNERDFPHLVELTVPPEGFRSAFLEFDAFHRDQRIPVRRGRSRHEAEQLYIRFCFSDTATADAFRNRFGGECLSHAPGNPKPRTSATSSTGREARRRRGLGEREVAVTNDRPWRLEDLTFVPSGDGRERATINGVEVVRRNKRYWIMAPNGPQYSDIAEKDVNAALDYLFRQRERWR
jgi:hypothetical protein